MITTVYNAIFTKVNSFFSDGSIFKFMLSDQCFQSTAKFKVAVRSRGLRKNVLPLLYYTKLHAVFILSLIDNNNNNNNNDNN